MYNIVDQLISCSDIKGSGRTVVLDIAYVTILLFRDVATVWKIKMVGTIGKQSKHLPSRFSDMQWSSKRWLRGFSRSLHNDGLNVAFWNGNNAVVFLDNDLESTRENWNQTEAQSGESRLSVYAPRVNTRELESDWNTKWGITIICLRTFSCPDLWNGGQVKPLWNGGQVKPSWSYYRINRKTVRNKTVFFLMALKYIQW